MPRLPSEFSKSIGLTFSRHGGREKVREGRGWWREMAGDTAYLMRHGGRAHLARDDALLEVADGNV